MSSEHLSCPFYMLGFPNKQNTGQSCPMWHRSYLHIGAFNVTAAVAQAL